MGSSWSVAAGLTAAVLLLSLPLACGDVTEPAKKAPAPFAYYTSGTRLRARLVDAGGGAARFVGWHDAGLDVDCTIRPTDHGYRCVPDVAPSSPVFSDPACTVPAWVGASPPSDLVVVADSVCGVDRYQVFRVGAETSPTAYLPNNIPSSTPSCIVDGSVDGSVYALHPADDELVQMTTSLVSLGELDVLLASGDDGSKQVVELVDHARGIPCVDVGADASGVDRCFASDAQPDFPDYSTHADCANGEGGVWTCLAASCPSATFGLSKDIASCASTPSFYALGPATPAYHVDNGVCSAIGYGPCTFFPNAAPIDPGSLPAITRVAIGTGRVKLETKTAKGSTSILGYGGFTDSMSSLPCDVHAIGSDDRCLPPWVSLGQGGARYADPACTKRVAPATPNDCPPRKIALLTTQTGATEIHALFAATTQAIYDVGPMGCEPLGMGQAYELDAKLDPATFPLVTTRTE